MIYIYDKFYDITYKYFMFNNNQLKQIRTIIDRYF